MRRLILLLLFFTHSGFGQQVSWKTIPAQTDASFRGLSVVDNKIAWVSGSKGRIGRSTNGGNNWTFAQVKGFEKLDFRSIYAFNARTAVIANAGSPAYILRTGDSGKTWTSVYRNDDTSAFIDAVDFWNNKDGIVYGDPLQGRMFLLKTNDGGKTWHELPASSRPAMNKGEASFAASGTCIRCFGKSDIAIVTGGTDCRLFISRDKCKTWSSMPAPMIKGQPGTGIFSVAWHNADTLMLVGGDYKNEKDSRGNACLFYYKGKRPVWQPPHTSTRGYRECVEYLSSTTAIAAGPAGIDISSDYGVNWKSLSDETGFHVIRKARTGNLIVLAGSNGKISLLRFTSAK